MWGLRRPSLEKPEVVSTRFFRRIIEPQHSYTVRGSVHDRTQVGQGPAPKLDWIFLDIFAPIRFP